MYKSTELSLDDGRSVPSSLVVGGGRLSFVAQIRSVIKYIIFFCYNVDVEEDEKRTKNYIMTSTNFGKAVKVNM